MRKGNYVPKRLAFNKYFAVRLSEATRELDEARIEKKYKGMNLKPAQ